MSLPYGTPVARYLGIAFFHTHDEVIGITLRGGDAFSWRTSMPDIVHDAPENMKVPEHDADLLAGGNGDPPCDVGAADQHLSRTDAVEAVQKALITVFSRRKVDKG